MQKHKLLIMPLLAILKGQAAHTTLNVLIHWQRTFPCARRRLSCQLACRRPIAQCSSMLMWRRAQVGFPTRNPEKLVRALHYTHALLWIRATRKSRMARSGAACSASRAPPATARSPPPSGTSRCVSYTPRLPDLALHTSQALSRCQPPIWDVEVGTPPGHHRLKLPDWARHTHQQWHATSHHSHSSWAPPGDIPGYITAGHPRHVSAERIMLE